MNFCFRCVNLYLIETLFNTFANGANPDKTAPVRAAYSGSTLFPFKNEIIYDHTLVDLTSNFFVLSKNVKVYLYNHSKWAELSMNIHD